MKEGPNNTPHPPLPLPLLIIIIIIIIIIRGLFSDIIVVLAQAGANTGNNSLFTNLLLFG